MSAFARDFFVRSPALVFPVLALVIFFVVFVAMVVRAMRTPSSEAEALAKLPLEGERP